VCIYSHRQGDTVLFHHEGGVEIGDVDAKVNWMLVKMMLLLHISDVDNMKVVLCDNVLL